MSAGRFVLRGPSGNVALDTADRMPDVAGTLSATVTATFPKVSGERTEGRVSGGGVQYRYILPAAEYSYVADIGPVTTAGTPNYLLTRYRVTPSGYYETIYGHVYKQMACRTSEWIPTTGGSLWLEHIRTSNSNQWLGNRHCHVYVSPSNRWTLDYRQSNAALTTDWTSPPGTINDSASTFSIELELSWGYFDL